MTKRHCMTCGKSTINESGFCSWDCKDIFLDEYKTNPTKKELKAMIITKSEDCEQK